jgi:hypothetical protein
MLKNKVVYRREIYETYIILIRDFSQELYVLPDDDTPCAIEICRSSESVLMCKILD